MRMNKNNNKDHPQQFLFFPIPSVEQLYNELIYKENGKSKPKANNQKLLQCHWTSIIKEKQYHNPRHKTYHSRTEVDNTIIGVKPAVGQGSVPVLGGPKCLFVDS